MRTLTRAQRNHTQARACRAPCCAFCSVFFIYRPLSTAPQSVLQLCARALVHAAAPSLSQGLCCGGGMGGTEGVCAAESHPTNEFLLTSRSPLKKQFVLKRRCAELPCSCLCSHARRRHHLLSALFCYLRCLSPPPSPPTASLIYSPCTLISFHANLKLKLTARGVLMWSRWLLRSRARSLLLLQSLR